MKEIDRCYDILGVTPSTTPDELKRAYRDLVRAWHPDRRERGSREQKLAEEKLKEINVAYAFLQSLDPAEARAAARPPRPTRAAYTPESWSRRAASQATGVDDAEREQDEETAREKARALHQEGQAHFERGRWREAVSSLLQSVCLVQGNADAYLTLGRAYRVLDMPAKAVSAFKQAIRLRPHSDEAHQNLGETYLVMGEYREAVWSCSQWLRHRPDSAGTLVTLGAAYRHLRRYPQALEVLSRAVALQPERPEAHLELGETHLALGDRAAARREVEILRPLSEDMAMKLLVSIATA